MTYDEAKVQEAFLKHEREKLELEKRAIEVKLRVIADELERVNETLAQFDQQQKHE